MTHLWNDDIVPVRQSPFNGQFEALEHGKFFGHRVTSVTRVVHDRIVVGVILLHGRGRGVEAATPYLNLEQTLNVVYKYVKVIWNVVL